MFGGEAVLLEEEVAGNTPKMYGSFLELVRCFSYLQSTRQDHLGRVVLSLSVTRMFTMKDFGVSHLFEIGCQLSPSFVGRFTSLAREPMSFTFLYFTDYV